MSASISQSESQRYDRQIRVWGAEAQARIQRSKVLICGLKKLNVEARNLLQVISVVLGRCPFLGSILAVEVEYFASSLM
eukprot:gene29864-39029_t